MFDPKDLEMIDDTAGFIGGSAVEKNGKIVTYDDWGRSCIYDTALDAFADDIKILEGLIDLCPNSEEILNVYNYMKDALEKAGRL